MTGKLRKFFPGGNTCNGFYSFYDNIIEPDATRIFVIKGGPGVGKSTFMRHIGSEMLERGYDIEFHCCSSDNDSLDGIVIPSIKVALLDGTAPHVVDPKNPGAVDEIVHLGDHWHEEKIVANKDAILEVNHKVVRMFKIAYSALKEAKVAHDEWESYITESMKFHKINKITQELINEIFCNISPQYEKKVKSRHLFGSAITPNGLVNEYESILQGCNKLYLLKGSPGSGKSTILETIYNTTQRYGLDTEVYHCAFEPNKLDALYILQLKTAILNVSPPLKFDYSKIDKKPTVINLDQYIDSKIILYYDIEIKSAETRFWNSMDRAVRYINKAKQLHDKMEKYYIPAMDFEAINSRRKEILYRILDYAK